MATRRPAKTPSPNPVRRLPVWLSPGGWLVLTLVLIIVTLVGRDLRLAGSAGSNVAQAAEIIDTGALRPLDGLTRVTLSAFRYNRVTGAFLGSATLTNTGPASLSGPLYLVAESVTPAGARITNATGVTASGRPYFNVSGLLTAGALAPGASARPQNLTIGVTSAVPVAVTLRAYGPPVHVNRPPQAEAGADQTAYVGQTLTLDGSHSVDPDGDPLSFSWSLVSRPAGSAAQLIGPGLVNPSFQVDRSGSYSIRLVVNDGSLDSAPDTVTVSTLNSRPTANAGANRTARVGDTVTLDGSGSSDVDGQPLTYHWTLATPVGSTAVLDDDRAVTPSLRIDHPGTYTATLIVNDGILDSAAASVAITTENSPPLACITADRPVFVGDTVALDGTCSSDPDGDPLTYAWSLTPPTGSSAAIQPATAATTSFDLDHPGTYVVQLVVNDGTRDSAPVTTAVTTENSRPVADPGPNRQAEVGDTVTLDGTRSSDADADPLSFQWSLLTRPDGSTAGLLDADRALASLLPDLPGLYVIQLIVNDGHLASDPGTARIEVIVGNGPPRLTSTAPVTAILGVPYRYTAEAQDPDDDPLRYSLPNAPAGMTIDPDTGLVQWTPAAGQAGPHQVSLRVQDPAGASDTQDYTLTVVANCTALPPGSAGACAITGLSVDHAPPGSELTIHGYGFDPDPANNRVRIGGVETDVIAIGPDGIRVRVPLTAADGTITVETRRGTMTGPAFTIDRAQDFALAASPAAIDLPQGARRVVQVQVGDAGTDPYQGLVELAVGTLPAGVSVEILPPTLTAGRPGTLLISAAQTASPGRYGIQVDGTGYTSGIRQTHGAGFMLQVLPNNGTQTGVTGRFITPEGAGIPGVIVRAEPVGAYGTSLGQTLTDAAGTFLLQGLPAGDLVLRIDSTPADPGYPIFPVSVTIADDRMTQLDDWVLRHQPPAERFSPIVPNSPQDQVITDPRLPGVEVRLLAGTSIIGWDGVPKTRMAIERIEPDRLPVDPPLQGAKSYYQLFFGTPMGGVPSHPVYVTLPNDLGLDPGEKADLWYFDGAPTGQGIWKTSGTGTVSADGQVIVTDPGSGIPRFCGVCGLSCFIPPVLPPDPPCPDCDPSGPPQNDGINPVTLSLGMELSSAVDLQIDGVMPITIGRVYNPWNAFVRNNQLLPAFGHGWYFTYDMTLYASGGGMRLVMPGNSRVQFTPSGAGTYVSSGDLRFRGAVLAQAGGLWQITFRDRRVWRFTAYPLAGADNVHLLTEQTDGKGNRLTIERNGGGRPVLISAPGRKVSIGIGNNGYISVVRDELGRTVGYTQGGQGRLAQVTAPDGKVTAYGYAEPPEPIRIAVSGAASGGSSGGGTQMDTSFGPAPGGPVYISSVSYPGTQTSLSLDYGQSMRVLRQTFGGLREVRFAYELRGACAINLNNPPDHRTGFCAGSNGPTEDSWENKQSGWLFFGGTLVGTRVTDANGNGYQVRFNTGNLGIEMTDALGQITRYDRDSGNQITAVTDPLGRITRYDYDGNGNITRITESTGRTTELTYHPTWNKVTAITRHLDDGTPVTYRFEYDDSTTGGGRLLRTIDPLGHVTRYDYTTAGDAHGLVASITDALGRVNNLTYSLRGDLTGVTDPLGHRVQLTHDLVGRLQSVTDALGATTRSETNVIDQVSRIIDANHGQTRFAYDTKRDPQSVVDALGHTVESYVTDDLHRLTRRTDALGAPETYQYDPAGRLISALDRKGQQVRLNYDRLDRVTRIDYADGSAETREYDAVSRLVKVTDPAGTIAFDYDELDRVVKETTEYGARINSVEYRYDALDRVLERTVNGLDPTTYTYDLASRPLTIAFRGTTVTYEWDEAGRLTTKTLPNGTRQEYGYDDADHLLEIRFVKSDGSLIDRIVYQYDANGRRIAKTTGLPSNDETPITGTYDQANRMTSVTFTSTGETCALGYDANGNLTTKTCPGGTTTYTWDPQDRLIAIDGPDLTARFAYDALGRRIERVVNGVTTGYLYDGVQAIAEFGDEDAALLTGFAIDEALGRFAASGDLTLLTDALGSVVAEAGEDGGVTTKYGYSPYGETAWSGDSSQNSTQFTGRETDATGIYHYRTRFYSPILYRFVQGDPIGIAGGLNRFSYVSGNPVSNRDPSGKFPDDRVLATPCYWTVDDDPSDPCDDSWDRLRDRLRLYWWLVSSVDDSWFQIPKGEPILVDQGLYRDWVERMKRETAQRRAQQMKDLGKISKIYDQFFGDDGFSGIADAHDEIRSEWGKLWGALRPGRRCKR